MLNYIIRRVPLLPRVKGTIDGHHNKETSLTETLQNMDSSVVKKGMIHKKESHKRYCGVYCYFRMEFFNLVGQEHSTCTSLNMESYGQA